MLTFDNLMNLEKKTCIILYEDKNTLNSNVFYIQLKYEFKDYDIVEYNVNEINEDVYEYLFEKILPSYAIIENGKILELGLLF